MQKSNEAEERDIFSTADSVMPLTAKQSLPLTPEAQARSKARLDQLIPEMLEAMKKDNEELGI